MSISTSVVGTDILATGDLLNEWRYCPRCGAQCGNGSGCSGTVRWRKKETYQRLVDVHTFHTEKKRGWDAPQPQLLLCDILLLWLWS